MIGWITPCCRIESASSPSSASAKSRRGLRGFGLRNSIGTLRCARGRSRCAASPPTSPIRLARPRPSRERASSAIASSLGFNSRAPVSLHFWRPHHFAVGSENATPNNGIAPMSAHGLISFLSMIFSENRFPLFRIMLLMRAKLALALDHFGCELEIGFAADAFEIVDQYRLAVRGRLGNADVAGDH